MGGENQCWTQTCHSFQQKYAGPLFNGFFNQHDYYKIVINALFVSFLLCLIFWHCILFVFEMFLHDFNLFLFRH